MNKERLGILASYLEALPVQGFYMGCWYLKEAATHCGTVACAFGHACDIPEFQKLGLHMKTVSMSGSPTKEGVPVFNGVQGFEAAKELFELSELEARALFSGYMYKVPSHKVTPQLVAARIREYIRE